jgi:hypothetical protein
LAAYHEWLGEEIKTRSENAREFLTIGQKFMDASTRLLSNGWPGIGSGA